MGPRRVCEVSNIVPRRELTSPSRNTGIIIRLLTSTMLANSFFINIVIVAGVQSGTFRALPICVWIQKTFTTTMLHAHLENYPVQIMKAHVIEAAPHLAFWWIHHLEQLDDLHLNTFGRHDFEMLQKGNTRVRVLWESTATSTFQGDI
jgi:hypothetical protein